MAEIEDMDEDFSEEGLSYNFRELMDMLMEKRDLIITVPADQVEQLKKGLCARKSKDSYKLNKAGVKAGSEVLSFNTYPAVDPLTKAPSETDSCVRVKLGPRKGVTVLNIEVPDDEI